MKKLLVLVLVLVLGMAVASNAAISFDVTGAVNGEVTINVSDTISIGIYSDAVGRLGQYDAILINTNLEGGVWTGDYTIAGYPLTLTDAEVHIAEEGDPAMNSVSNTTTSIIQLDPGVGFTFDFHCIAAGEDVVILLLDPSVGETPVDMLMIHQVPEPITIALLGLGGLFVHRRKKISV